MRVGNYPCEREEYHFVTLGIISYVRQPVPACVGREPALRPERREDAVTHEGYLQFVRDVRQVHLSPAMGEPVVDEY